MMRALVGWSLAFLLTAGSAGGVLWGMLKRPSPPPSGPVRRVARTVGDVELAILLNKIREGDLQAIKGDLAAARQAWTEAHRMGEGLWAIHDGLGDSYARAKLYEEALAEYHIAEALAPSESFILLKRAGILEQIGRPEEAFETYLELDQPHLYPKLLELSDGSLRKEQLLQIVSHRAKERDPRLHLLVHALCNTLGRKADAARALSRYAIVCVPWDRNVTGRAIDLLRAEKFLDEALDVGRAWAKALPQDVHAYRAMGDLHRDAGREKEAWMAYTSIVDVRPGDADAHRLLGQILLQMKRYDEALAQFEKSKNARPEEPERWIDSADAWAARGEAKKAGALYDEIARKSWDGRFGRVVQTVRYRQAQRHIVELEEAKRKGQTDRVREIRQRLAGYGLQEHELFDLKVILTWDTQGDIDLDVIDPSEERVDHGHAESKAGGRYYVDNTQAYGPETFTLAKAPAGRYRIGAHDHSATGTARIVILLHEDTPRESRQEYTLVFTGKREQLWVPDITLR